MKFNALQCILYHLVGFLIARIHVLVGMYACVCSRKHVGIFGHMPSCYEGNAGYAKGMKGNVM